MQATHGFAVVSLILVLPSAVGFAGDTIETSASLDGEVPTASDTLPDGRTMFNVGFDRLPDVGAGGVYQGAEVLVVHEDYGFLTVATAQPAAFRQAAVGDPDTFTVERDSPTALEAMAMPNDRRAGAQWGIEAKPGVDALGAWENGFGTGEATVAVIDSGIDDTHPDLEDTQEPSRQGFCPVVGCVLGVPAQDTCPHGTHVAGTIAARANNSIGVAGISQANLIDLDILHQAGFSCVGSAASAADAIDAAVDVGADVISMSLGGVPSALIETAVRDAWNAGALVVAAAGNDGCTSQGSTVGFPAAYGVVVAVSSIDHNGTLSSFSSCGPEVDVAAPGTAVMSTIPGGSYLTLSGTSMAAPHVSGAAALALSQDPSLTNQELRDALNASAEPTNLPARQVGHGLLDVCQLVGDVGGSVDCNDGLPYAINKSYVAHGEVTILQRNVGGVSFPIVPNGTSSLDLDIEDDAGQSVGALVQFRDHASSTIGQHAICESASLDVPDNTTRTLVFFGNSGGLTMPAPCFDGSGVATTGVVHATFT